LHLCKDLSFCFLSEVRLPKRILSITLFVTKPADRFYVSKRKDCIPTVFSSISVLLIQKIDFFIFQF